MTGPSWRKDVEEKLDDHDERLDKVENDVSFFQDRENGIKLVLRAVVVAIAAIGGLLAIAKAIGAI